GGRGANTRRNRAGEESVPQPEPASTLLSRPRYYFGSSLGVDTCGPGRLTAATWSAGIACLPMKNRPSVSVWSRPGQAVISGGRGIAQVIPDDGNPQRSNKQQIELNSRIVKKQSSHVSSLLLFSMTRPRSCQTSFIGVGCGLGAGRALGPWVRFRTGP